MEPLDYSLLTTLPTEDLKTPEKPVKLEIIEEPLDNSLLPDNFRASENIDSKESPPSISDPVSHEKLERLVVIEESLPASLLPEEFQVSNKFDDNKDAEKALPESTTSTSEFFNESLSSSSLPADSKTSRVENVNDSDNLDDLSKVQVIILPSIPAATASSEPPKASDDHLDNVEVIEEHLPSNLLPAGFKTMDQLDSTVQFVNNSLDVDDEVVSLEVVEETLPSNLLPPGIF